MVRIFSVVGKRSELADTFRPRLARALSAVLMAAAVVSCARKASEERE